jgi:cytochrome P450
VRITAAEADVRTPLDRIDLVDPEGFRSGCQHATWARLRHEAPVWWHERPGGQGFWCVTRHADCELVIKDHRTYSSEHGTILASVGVGDSAGGQTITLMDPPRHTQIRLSAMRALSHSIVRERAERIRAGVRRLVEPCLEGEQDFARLMRRLPMTVAGELMGVPESLWDGIAFWTTASIAPEDPEYARGATVRETLRQAHHELFACFAELIRHRRAHPGEDLISMLVAAEPDGRRMDDWRVLLNCYSFVLGASTTTPHVATHTVQALAERPALWAAVAAEPHLVPRLVEEGVRWTSPTHHLVRRVSRDTEIRGVRIAAGDWMCAWVASANRDEDVFEDPYRFDPRRERNPHQGFGAGPHYCIGAPSSRLALGMLFEELTGRLESLEVTGPVTHLYSNWINGLVSMPVVGRPRRAGG